MCVTEVIQIRCDGDLDLGKSSTSSESNEMLDLSKVLIYGKKLIIHL